MTTNQDKELAQDIATLMNGWNKIEEAAKKQFPNAKEQPQQITQSTI